MLSYKPKCESPCGRKKMSLLRNYFCTNQTNIQTGIMIMIVRWRKLNMIHQVNYLLIAKSKFDVVLQSISFSNRWKLHVVDIDFSTLIFIFLTANDQPGQVLPTMKETGFDVVSQGTVNRNVRSIKSTRKSSYKKYTSRCRFKITKYANETGYSATVRKFKPLFPNLLNKSTVHGCRNKYLHQMKDAEKRNRSPEKSTVNLEGHYF